MLIVILAGVDTDATGAFNLQKPGDYGGFFIELISYLQTHLTNLGYKPTFKAIYPYGIGTGDIKFLDQAMSVLADMGNMYTTDRIKETVEAINYLERITNIMTRLVK